jgi:poly(A) polymerase
VAFVCQLYPRASPSTLLAKFFRVYAEWEWPKPVMLNQIMPPPPSSYNKKTVWNEQIGYNHAMPIITPAYPAMNSSEKVTRHTRTVIQQEMTRANNILRQIIHDREVRKEVDESTGQTVQKLLIDWEKLFEPSDFFIKYAHYLACNIIGTGDNAESRQWIGFVESRILSFAKQLEYLPLMHPIHLFPIVSKTQKSENSLCYFIGFDIDKKAVNKREGVRVDISAQKFM